MLPESIHGKKILISCLNWGYGHVSRSIPLIHRLIQQENKIYFAGSKEQNAIIENYFHDVNFIEHADYPFQFSGKGNFGTDLLKSYFPLTKRIKREQKEVEQYVIDYGIDVIISDHRYGFYSTKVPSICLVHQLNLALKWHQSAGQIIHHRLLRKFDELWVPDNPNSHFAGKLSKNKSKFNASYIGTLSRFSLEVIQEKTIENMVILSGPLVYAQQLYDQLIVSMPEDTIYIGSPQLKVNSKFNFIPSSDWKHCDEIILKAKKIISRSGYSTIMDLSVLNVPHKLYATPGQVEQEYLKQIHS